MFSFFTKKIVSDSSVATPAPVSSSSSSNSGEGFEVHTIPQKFLPIRKSRAYTIRHHMIIGVMVVFFGAIVFGFAAWLLVRTIRQNEHEQLSAQHPFVRPLIIPTTTPPTSEPQSLLHTRDYGECTYAAIEGGKGQQRILDSVSFTQYAANYFCPRGSMLVQISSFASPGALAQFIDHQATSVVEFRDGIVAEKNNSNSLAWGSGQVLVQVTLQSLERDSLALGLLLDEYRSTFIPTQTLPWRKEIISVSLTPQERDAIRLQEVKKIQVALEFYKIDTGTYPPVLDPASLPTLAQYLPRVPAGPITTASTTLEYIYTALEGATTYQLAFGIEAGIAAYPAGAYLATPAGIVSAGASSLPSLLPTGNDLDRDGMTDTEEVVWGTNAQIADTDGDGYSDRQELLNRFDPLVGGGAKLENSVRVKNYVSPVHQFTLSYPVAWKLVERNETELQLSTNERGLLFQVLVDTLSPPASTTEEWYTREFSAAPRGTDTRVTIASGQTGLLSPDALTFYLLVKQKLYLITYLVGGEQVLEFPATFAAFIRSLRFFENPNK